MAATDEAVRYTTNAESLLRSLSSNLKGVAASTDATIAAISYVLKFRDEERQRVADAEERSRRYARANTKLLDTCNALLAALGDGKVSPAKITRLKTRLEMLVGTGGEHLATPGATARAAEMLRILSDDHAWRQLDFVEGGRLEEHVLWQGNLTLSERRHPAQLARFIRTWLLDESPDGRDERGEFEDD